MGLSIFLLITMLSLGFSQTSHVAGFNYERWKNCDDIVYRRPDVFYVQGQASQQLAPTIGYITLGIEITDMDAAKALNQVRTNINNAISALQKLLGKPKFTTYTTSQLTIQPWYEQVYDPKTDQYTQEFKGYKVTHQLTIRSKNLDKLGSIIDTAITNGLNSVQSVTFDFEPEERQKIQDDMIGEAMIDAQKRAELALQDKYIGYVITGIKSISLNYPQPIYYQKDQMISALSRDSGPTTQVFAGQQQIEQIVNVGFIIEPQ